MAWEVKRKRDEAHVVPRDDIHPHTTSGTGCACKPKVEHVDCGKIVRRLLVIHNSFDGREVLEQKYQGVSN